MHIINHVCGTVKTSIIYFFSKKYITNVGYVVLMGPLDWRVSGKWQDKQQ